MNNSINKLILLVAYLAYAQSNKNIPTEPTRAESVEQPFVEPHPYLKPERTGISIDSIELCVREGLNRIPGECHSYVDCIKTDDTYQVYKYRCPEGRVFDQSDGTCSWPFNVPECMSGANDRPFTEFDEFIFNSRLNTNISDISMEVTEEKNILELTTILPELASNTNRSNITVGFENKDFRCPTVGLERHPLNCSQYYSCDKTDSQDVYVLNVFDCPKQLFFDPSAQLCDWPRNVPICDLKLSRPRPISPPYSTSGLQTQRPPYQPPKSNSHTRPIRPLKNPFRPSNSGTKGFTGGKITSNRRPVNILPVRDRPTPRPTTQKPPVKGFHPTTPKALTTAYRPMRPTAPVFIRPTAPPFTRPPKPTPSQESQHSQHESQETDSHFPLPIVMPPHNPYGPQQHIEHSDYEPPHEQHDRYPHGSPHHNPHPQYPHNQYPHYPDSQPPHYPHPSGHHPHNPHQSSQNPYYPNNPDTNYHYPHYPHPQHPPTHSPHPPKPHYPHPSDQHPHNPQAHVPHPQYPSHNPHPHNQYPTKNPPSLKPQPSNPRPPYLPPPHTTHPQNQHAPNPHPQNPVTHKPHPHEPHPHYPHPPESHPQHPYPHNPYPPSHGSSRKCRIEGEFLTDPYDCTKFHRCSNGIIYSFDCPSGLLFDNSLYVCNWPSDVAQPCGRPRSPHLFSADTPTTIADKPTDKKLTEITPIQRYYNTMANSQPNYWVSNQHIIHNYPIDTTSIQVPQLVSYPTIYYDQADDELIILSQHQLLK